MRYIFDENFDTEKLHFTWIPFYYQNKTLKIFLNITSPAEISSLIEGPDDISLDFYGDIDNIIFSPELQWLSLNSTNRFAKKKIRKQLENS